MHIILCTRVLLVLIPWKKQTAKKILSFSFVSKRSQTNHFSISNTRRPTLTSSLYNFYSIVCDRYIEKCVWPPQKWQLADEWYFNFQIQPLSFFRCWLFSCRSHRLLFIQYTQFDNKKKYASKMVNVSRGYRVNLNHRN